MTLADRLRRLREDSKFTKRYVAHIAGVSDVVVGYWESGRIEEIGHQRLMAVARVYGLSLTDLIGDRKPHWTDKHMRRDGAEWVGFDEAGLELTRGARRDDVRDAMVIHSHEINQAEGANTCSR